MIKRKSIAFLVSIIIAIGALWVPISAETGSHPTLRVGYYEESEFFGPLVGNQGSGYGYDYLKELSYYARWNYEFVPGTWEECVDWLESGEIDLLPVLHYTHEMDEKFALSTEDVGQLTPKLLAAEANTALQPGNLPQHQGLSVGFVAGSTDVMHLHHYAQEIGLAYSPVNFVDEASALTALESGEVDTVCLSTMRLPPRVQVLASLVPQPMKLAVRKNDYVLFGEMNEAIALMGNLYSSLEQVLQQKYFSDASDRSLMFSQAELEFLATHPVIEVAIDPHYMPMEGFHTMSGEAQGVTVQFLEYVATITGLQFEFVSMTDHQVALSLMDDGGTALMSGLNQSLLAHADVETSGVYLEAALVLIGEDTFSAEGDTVTIALTPRTVGFQSLVSESYPNAVYMQMDSQEEAYDAVHSGQVDLMLTNIYTAQAEYLVRDESLRILQDLGVYSQYRFAIGADQSVELIGVLDKVIEATSGAEINAMLLAASLPEATTETNLLQIILSVLLVSVAIVVSSFLFVKLRNARKRLIRLAYYDDLTGERNLKKFLMDADELRSKYTSTGFALVILDIRNFQMFNDFHGFEEGNRLLRLMAHHLGQRLDSGRELFGRVGSDEFIIMVVAEDEEQLQARLQASEAYMQRLLKDGPYARTRVTFVYGAYLIGADEPSMSSAYEKVNLAHKEAKRNESVNHHIYDDSMRIKAMEEQEIERTMEQALADQEFKLFLQPQYFTDSERIYGAEALVRWQKADGRLTPPFAFLPLFERNGFVTRLDFYMFEQCCQMIRKWLDNGIPPVPLSVNFSRLHLTNQHFVSKLCHIADQYRVPHRYLVVELTESVIIDHQGQLDRYLQQLHANDFALSMDDFGSGYSSLGLLKSLHVDAIKLDRSFFTGDKDTARMLTIVQSVLRMAKELGIKTVAEGIEEAYQVAYLKQMDCHIIQGYYFAKPMPADDVTNLLREMNRPDSPS